MTTPTVLTTYKLYSLVGLLLLTLPEWLLTQLDPERNFLPVVSALVGSFLILLTDTPSSLIAFGRDWFRGFVMAIFVGGILQHKEVMPAGGAQFAAGLVGNFLIWLLQWLIRRWRESPEKIIDETGNAIVKLNPVAAWLRLKLGVSPPVDTDEHAN